MDFDFEEFDRVISIYRRTQISIRVVVWTFKNLEQFVTNKYISTGEAFIPKNKSENTKQTEENSRTKQNLRKQKMQEGETANEKINTRRGIDNRVTLEDLQIKTAKPKKQ